MNLRKIAVVGGFAVGAALTLAPLASADVVSIDSTFDSEVSELNSLFQTDALLAGDSNDITIATTPGVFDSIKPEDLATIAPHLVPGDTGTPTFFEDLVYGANPIEAGISTGTGPFNELNGALSEFFNAYNVEAYSLLNDGATVPVADLFGNPAGLETILGEGTSSAVTQFITTGLGDLEGYLGIFTSM